ncbi:MAG TPA: hypothetical protein VFE89_05625 [Beijerinckiaceae bacterium]|jgi:hypothetical protein|nr:hypothetical protein [Beijerinckiaceae bacterium]
MQDDLNRPLGLKRDPESRFGRPVAWLPLAFAGLGLIAISLIAFIIITGDRKNSIAIGRATGLPGSIDRIARLARSLEDRGIALVPVSAAASVKSQPRADARQR